MFSRSDCEPSLPVRMVRHLLRKYLIEQDGENTVQLLSQTSKDE